jgi:mitochondrial GTPase 1
VPKVVEWLQNEAKGRFKTAGALVMVAGMPNVGKSTFINTLAAISLKEKKDNGKFETNKWLKNSAKHRVKVGHFPGVTRSLSSVLVSHDPLVRMLDTPGIMIPKIENVEVGLRLALTGAIKDEVCESLNFVYAFHQLCFFSSSA